ncbi:MAG: YgjV family protein [Firmicutes bacterium]|nr:YgjV family protein [Bacillota bacterium]
MAIGWFILAQVMGGFTIIFEFISYQIKNQRRYLLCTSIANVFWALMFIFMGLHIDNIGYTLIMIYAAVFGVIRSMIFWFIFAKKTRRRKILGRIALYISLAIVFGAGIFAIINLTYTHQQIIQALGLVTGILFVVGQYLPSKHYLRIFLIMYAVMVAIGSTPLILGPGEWAPMSIAIEAFKVASVVIFYAAWFANSKRRALGENAPPRKPLPPWMQRLVNIIQGTSKETGVVTFKTIDTLNGNGTAILKNTDVFEDNFIEENIAECVLEEKVVETDIIE